MTLLCQKASQGAVDLAARDAEIMRLTGMGRSEGEIAAAMEGVTINIVRNVRKTAKLVAAAGSAPRDIPLALCYPADDARTVDEAAVRALAASIEAVGLLQPISVRPAVKVRAGQDADAFEVMAGMHRVKAMRRLGRETIPAFVLDADDLHAALILIDENLCRNDLSPAERAAQVAKRKRIYEVLYPEAKAGSIRARAANEAMGHNVAANSAATFADETAKATGISERTVRREAQRGEALGEDTLKRVARTSLDKGEELDALIKLPPPQREALIARAEAGEKVTAKHAQKAFDREVKENLLARRIEALPEKRYGVILADPEWRFEPWSRESGMDRAADNHYPTSGLDAIMARPVASIAADDSVLFLWATAPMLPQALAVMEAWGFARLETPRLDRALALLDLALAEFGARERNEFDPALAAGHWSHDAECLLADARRSAAGEYRSHFVWAKDRIGTGYWSRNRHELLLVGARGNVPAPAAGMQWESLIEAAVGAHSVKPERFLELIESYFPTLPKIELNRRGPARAGWDAWGNEAEAAVGNRQSAVERSAALLCRGAAGEVGSECEPGGIAVEDGTNPATKPPAQEPLSNGSGEVQDRCASTSPPDFEGDTAPHPGPLPGGERGEGAAPMEIPAFLRRSA